MQYMCPVCGYIGLDNPPYGGKLDPSYEICPCCSFEYGYDDASEGFTFQQWRKEWIDGGMIWNRISHRPPPPNWDPETQVAKVMHINGGGLDGDDKAALELLRLNALANK